ncbi:MAG: Holliday junction branch migration protein RuvA [Elusimicrobia bacterium]|nr:Holliday junction branch migration protein RuvA [Candidatus Liberimonas magnetica]
MITHLKGKLDKKSLNKVVIDAGGVGYEVMTPQSAVERLPDIGHEVKLYIVESFSMYAGGTTLYGFLSEEEREIYLLLKEEIPGAGAKKALDYLDKVSKSLPDFRQAIVRKDISILTGVFGFTKKTAEKVISSLKDKIAEIQISGKQKWPSSIDSSIETEAIFGLIALGYKEGQARDAVERSLDKNKKAVPVEEIIKRALKYL